MKSKFFLNINFQIFSISLVLFLIKWSLSFYFYGPETLNLKVIFNPSGDYSYYPFVVQLSKFKFNEGYSLIFNDLNLIGFPFLVSFFHAVFFKIFNIVGFILLELVCIFIFIKIFFHIFKELKFSNINCILLGLFFFTIPNLAEILNFFQIPYSLNIKQLYAGFYNLRFPRPLITNLFFFGFILFLLKFYLNNKPKAKNKNLILSFVFLGLLFNSFFFFFIVCSLLIFLIIIIHFKKKFIEKENLNILFKSCILLFIICIPFLSQIFFIENDYYSRIGTYNLTSETKIFLIKHLINGLKKLEFILIFAANLIFYFINIRSNSNIKKFLEFFWLLFLSSILAPIIYLFLMKQITFFGNFTFIIALTSMILLKINFIIFIFSNFSLNTKIINSIISLAFFALLSFNSIYFFKTSKVNLLSEGIHFNAKNIEKFRSDFKNVINFLKKNSQKNDLLLTNDIHTQIWWILSERNYFYFPYVFFVALNDNMIETQLINSFKYLKLDKNDFINYFNENKITDWRVVNTNNYFFLGHLKYQTNFLTKMYKADSYPEETKKFISKKSIHHTNQVILSSLDLERLRIKFDETILDVKLEPNIIVLFKDKRLTKNLDKIENFSIVLDNSNFLILKNNANN